MLMILSWRLYMIIVYMPQRDGLEETWYILDDGMFCSHIGNEAMTIEYYFEETAENGTSWSEFGLTSSEINELKNAYANSMKKWNNVFFYSYDSDGNVIKNKVIEIKEGTASSHNLSIYPISIENGYNAETIGDSEFPTETIEWSSNPLHVHIAQWVMRINIDKFNTSKVSVDNVNKNKQRVGAHEIGHILGLKDVDDLCAEQTEHYGHHSEVLMGYGLNHTDNTSNITYKDIAGVAITRGFHTDSDHKWLNCGQDSDHENKYKLLCSICNGVKYVSSLNGYTYNTYNYCNGEHYIGLGNMMAVASYGEFDYYKCKYCKYVAPFSMIEFQDYSQASYYNATYHRYTNYVEGLEYQYVEEHNLDSDGYCTECDAHIEHEYGPYIYNGYTNHIRTCSCGSTQTASHCVYRDDIVDGRYVNCIGCGALLDLNNDMSNIIESVNLKYSVNGSYLLPSGIAVLVDEDVEAYLNGTLQFYYENDLPVTQ